VTDDDPAVRAALYRMVIRMEGNPETQEDLFQEAWLYFWSSERQYPDHRVGWYLQGVEFHLKDLRKAGRSLDSTKRRGTQASFPDHSVEWDHWQDSLQSDESFMSTVSARDIFILLSARLMADDQRILGELAQGQGIRKIAGRLKTSRQSVLRGRKRIAALAIKLGVVPPTHSTNRDAVCRTGVR